MTLRCPDTHELHAFVDRALSVSRADGVVDHLATCGSCRDAVMALQSLESYFLRAQEVTPGEDAGLFARALAESAALDRRTATADPSRADASRPPVGAGRFQYLRWAMVSAAVAASLTLAVFLVSSGGEPDPLRPMDPTRASVSKPIESPLPALLESLDPDLEQVAGDALFRDLVTAMLGDAAEGPLTPFVSPATVVALVANGDSPVVDRLRAARVAAALGDDRAVMPLLRFAASSELTPFELRHALQSVAAFGGRSAADNLLRLAERRKIPEFDLARALVATGHAPIAPRVATLLDKAGVYGVDRLVEIDALEGPYATRILVDAYLAGEDRPFLVHALLRRPGAVRLLQRQMASAPVEVRVRALEVIGMSGSAEAVPELARALRRPEVREPALRALRAIMGAGSPAALDVLVRELPLLETAATFDEHPERSFFESSLSQKSGWITDHLTRRLDGERDGTPEHRRLLLALALTQDPAAKKAFHSATATRRGRGEALVAVSLWADPSAVDLLIEALSDRERSVRRAAIDGLVRLGGEVAASRISISCLEGADRRYLLRALLEDGRPWARPLLEALQRYSDCGLRARRLLAQWEVSPTAP